MTCSLYCTSNSSFWWDNLWFGMEWRVNSLLPGLVHLVVLAVHNAIHPVNLKTDLVEVEDKFVAISYPKTPQRIHFLWKFMPVQTNLLLTLFLDDPVQWYSFLLLHLYTIFTPHPLVQSAFMFRLSEIWLWLHHCWIEFQFGQKREQASLIFCQTWIGNRIELLGYLQKFA